MDFQTQQCRHLLATVVNLAVNDACQVPGRERPSADAMSAMRFLFDETVSGLNEYAELLDINPGQFRARLLKIMKTGGVCEINGYSESHRIYFMRNYRFWQQNPNQPEIEDVDD
jgi:hypothetical protein